MNSKLRGLPPLCLLAIISFAAAWATPPRKHWIFFRDKGANVLVKGSAAMQEAENRLTPRALARRAKVLPPDQLITEDDLSIAASYRAVLEQRGFKVIRESRWLNGVSVLATDGEAELLRELPFVKEVRPVARLSRPRPDVTAMPPKLFISAAHQLNYGQSFTQNAQIQVPALHDAGINGHGVLIGMLDSGFRWQEHEAFIHLRSRIIAERDFVNDDDLTRNEAGDVGAQDSHGTQVLSVLAGFAAGQLIGPAYGAQFVLAKTENLPTETHAEEDNWAEAIEWMEGLGVDVASSSLGYGQFDPGQGDYTPEDLDGKTTKITQAAEAAVAKGVVVVNSAGNRVFWDQINAPADGEHVITVGAVTAGGVITTFSSIGPTADGRIKPDVMALGQAVRVVVPSKITEYTINNGTSFSCPLVAGVTAQILSAHPDLKPDDVMEALRQTAGLSSAPNNEYGYGIVNARAAITYFGPAFSNMPEVEPVSSSDLRVTVRILSQAGLQSNGTFAHYTTTPSSGFTSVMMAQTDSLSYSAILPQVAETDTIRLYFSAREANATAEVTYPKNAPASLLRILGNGQVLRVDPRPAGQAPEAFSLFQNFPNPIIAGATTIRFQLEKSGPVTVKIFNRLGQEVTTLAANQNFAAGRQHDLTWDGRNAHGDKVAAGIYFYQLSFNGIRRTHKMLLLPQ
jgi:subtilisin family serine protease